ncbi:MAG TPA: NYN domain-containing protein, partial [Actinomycetota bacterium]|nr:NYN domain-containing protein [Actinomycetota bacterium]
MSERATGSRELGDGLAPPAAPAEAGTPAAPAGEGPTSLPDVPEALLAGYLDAALAALRATPAAELPGALRQYQSWTPRRLRHPRVLGLVRRSLDTDAGFRAAVDRRVLEEEEALARLVRSGRHADALASGEAPEAVARVAVALGREGEAAVHAAVEAAVADQARAQAARAESALAEAESELDSARARAESEAAAARAAREDARATRDELRRADRQVQALTERAEALEQQLPRARAAVQSARAEAAAEQRRLNGRLAELQARLAESQRQYRALRRSANRVDPVVAEAVGMLERDLAALQRATGVTEDTPVASLVPPTSLSPSARRGVPPSRPPRREPLPVPGGRNADDPETLAAWMAAPGVLVLVDGYNVTKHERGFPDRSLEDQRTLLVDLCRRLARRWGPQVTVVFDGAEIAPLPTKVRLEGVGVVFTDAGRIADDEIVARVNAEPPERPVVVVSSDNELRERAAALGASVTRSP